MKILRFSMFSLFVCVFGVAALAYAEIIYTKEGHVIRAVIIERTDDTIWYEVKSGNMTEEIGIDISDVDNVLNDDGSVSRHSPRAGRY